MGTSVIACATVRASVDTVAPSAATPAAPDTARGAVALAAATVVGVGLLGLILSARHLPAVAEGLRNVSRVELGIPQSTALTVGVCVAWLALFVPTVRLVFGDERRRTAASGMSPVLLTAAVVVVVVSEVVGIATLAPVAFADGRSVWQRWPQPPTAVWVSAAVLIVVASLRAVIGGRAEPAGEDPSHGRHRAAAVLILGAGPILAVPLALALMRPGAMTTALNSWAPANSGTRLLDGVILVGVLGVVVATAFFRVAVRGTAIASDQARERDSPT